MEKTYPECQIKKIIDISSLHTFFRCTYENDFYFDGEAHNFWEVVFVLSGTVGITADDEIFYLHPNQVIFHKPMEFHRIWAEKGKTAEVCIISFSADMPDLKNKVYNIPANLNDGIAAIHTDALSSFEISFNSVSVKENMILNAQIIINRIEILFSHIISENNVIDKRIKSKSINSYALIINTLGKNLDKRLSVEEIAAMCDMSASYLKKIFFKYSQSGIIRYFNIMKINRAKAMLMSGMSVKETASALGFDDQNYFSTLFKRLTGKTPTEYK